MNLLNRLVCMVKDHREEYATVVHKGIGKVFWGW